MNPEVITALAALLTAAATAFAIIVSAIRTGRKVDGVSEKSDAADVKLDEIHLLVNSRLSEALDRIEKFEQRLGLQPGDDPNGDSRQPEEEQ